LPTPLARAVFKIEKCQSKLLLPRENEALKHLLLDAVSQIKDCDYAAKKRPRTISHGKRRWPVEYSNFGRVIVRSRAGGKVIAASGFGSVAGDFSQVLRQFVSPRIEY
jgi:hypothetical protein